MRTDIGNLKCENVRLWGDAQTFRRFKTTKEFIGRKFTGGQILDCGTWNQFGEKMATELGAKYCPADDTDFDIDGLYFEYDWAEPISAVFCFEILEHLLNPLGALATIKWECEQDNAKAYVTFPRVPRWLQSDRHFHEFRDIEFRTLVDKAGFEIVRYESHRNRHDWLFYLTGFRPFIRLWCMLFGLSKIHFYELRCKR